MERFEDVSAVLRRVRDAARRHERRLIVAYIAVLALGGGIIAAAPVREWALGKTESAAIRWDNRWIARVEHGERLLNDTQYVEAVAYLEKLDREFPAQHVKHRLDKERQRVLRALGAGYIELGKKTLALETYRRLVAFDPNDYRSHYELAQAAMGFEEFDEAVAQFKLVLAIHPSHLPSMRGLFSRLVWDGEFVALNAAFEEYLDSYVMRSVAISLDSAATSVFVPADGRFHDVEVRLDQPAGWAGRLAITAGGLALEADSVTLTSPMAAGALGVSTWRYAASADSVLSIVPQPDVESVKDAASAAISVAVPAQPRGVSVVRLRVKLRKPVDPDLAEVVRKSFTNKLQHERLADAQRRFFIVPAGVAEALLAPRQDAPTVNGGGAQ